MSDESMGRRTLMKRAGGAASGALVVSAALAAPVSANDGTGDERSLSGGWSTSRSDSDGYTARGVWTFASGGVTHYQDIAPIGSLLHGTWAVRSGAFRYEVWGAIEEDPAAGTPALTARVAGRGTVRRDALSSPYVVTLFDAASRSEVFRYDGTITGARIQV